MKTVLFILLTAIATIGCATTEAYAGGKVNLHAITDAKFPAGYLPPGSGDKWIQRSQGIGWQAW